MIISIDAETTFNKIQYEFMTNSQQNAYEETHLNIIRAIYEKPTDNAILNGENLKAFPLRPGKGCPFNII